MVCQGGRAQRHGEIYVSRSLIMLSIFCHRLLMDDGCSMPYSKLLCSKLLSPCSRRKLVETIIFTPWKWSLLIPMWNGLPRRAYPAAWWDLHHGVSHSCIMLSIFFNIAYSWMMAVQCHILNYFILNHCRHAAEGSWWKRWSSPRESDHCWYPCGMVCQGGRAQRHGEIYVMVYLTLSLCCPFFVIAYSWMIAAQCHILNYFIPIPLSPCSRRKLV